MTPFRSACAGHRMRHVKHEWCKARMKVSACVYLCVWEAKYVMQQQIDTLPA